MTKDQQSRAIHIQLEFKQSSQTVWESFIQEDQLTKWFPQKARVNPGKGGSIIWEWDDLGKFDLEIDTWEEGKHLRLLDRKKNSHGEPVVQVIDITMEAQTEGCLLKLVHSGFGLESEWDEEFAGVCAGWNFELRILRHYLNYHQGKERHLVLWDVASPFDPEETRAIILGPDAFLQDGEIESKREGETYTMRSALEDQLDGIVLVNHAPVSFAGVIPSMDHAVFRYEREGNAAFIALEMWGEYAKEVQAFKDKWKPKLKTLLEQS